MRYIVLIATEGSDWEQADEARQQEYFDAHEAFERFVTEHGTHRGGAALSDADLATTIRRNNGQETITDGPFVELTEQIAGFYDIDVPDLDTALEAARLLPSAYTLEVRSVVGVEGYEGG